MVRDIALVVAIAAAAVAGYFFTRPKVDTPPAPPAPVDDGPLRVHAPEGSAPEGMVWIPGGEFVMGSTNGQTDEVPLHRVVLDGFWMDRTEVTNRAFAKFVEATGFKTVAEKQLMPKDVPYFQGVPPEGWPPGGLAYTKPEQPVGPKDYRNWWRFLPGANWRAPEGPGSTIVGREDHPVVHVSWTDAVAYAEWAGKALPTEAQWEYAARGGLPDSEFPWGASMQRDDGSWRCNIWQGDFPNVNERSDGFATTAPVGSFDMNGYTLHDMSGNVWEWCSDLYHPETYRYSPLRNPAGAESGADPDNPGVPVRVQRGGSFMCADCYCRGYRVATRMKAAPDNSAAHTGFRCVVNPK